MTFCATHGYQPVPASVLTVKRYIAYLSTRLSYKSVRVYLNVVRLLHIQAGLDNPIEDCTVKMVLKGLRRVLKDNTYKRPVIDMEILALLRNNLNLQNGKDMAIWTTCLIAFFGMLRMSSIFPPAMHRLLVSNASVYDWGIKIRFQYSKTVQFNERQPYVVLPWNKDSSMCAATNLLRNWKISGCDVKDPLISFKCRGILVPLTRNDFINRITSILQAHGLHGYTGHSFRRGGATHALYCNIPSEVIMAQGDWKSMAYLEYIDASDASSRAGKIISMYK